jgi:hypothetical protein
MLPLDVLTTAAIEEEYYTADGKRVMLPLKALIELGLVSESASEKLKEKLDVWHAANPRLTLEEDCND